LRWCGEAARTQGGRGTIGCRRSSAFWGLGCPKTHHEIKDSLDSSILTVCFFNAKAWIRWAGTLTTARKQELKCETDRPLGIDIVEFLNIIAAL